MKPIEREPANRTTRVSALFRYLEAIRGGHRWGRLLDAGTGAKSLEWIATLPTESWTAITASHRMADKIRDAPGVRMRDQDRLLVGNWANDSLLTGETFDTVLVDYLIGAIEGFAPYWQGRLFDRFRPLVKDTGRLYIIGLEPYVPYRPDTESGRVLWEIGRVRDACLLLAGERPYREYPADWVLRRLGEAGFRVLETRHFPIRFREHFVNSQLDMCLDRLTRFASEDLATSMRRYTEDLRARALALQERENGLRSGRDYVIAAEPMPPE
ncbi:MAG: class I SAM-dependent methyltransferase [Actinomycetota bacterium]|nr:class I SAM-dependent methyltransferase [Actinomycetota bacterium]